MNGPKPKLLFMGAGNVAWHLAPALQQAGYDIVQVYSRTMESAGKLAGHLEVPGTDNIEDLPRDADLALFAISDSAIEFVLENLPFEERKKLHMSAIIANNFSNHMYHLAAMISKLRYRMSFRNEIMILPAKSIRLHPSSL